jgi:hypothetical protein
MDEGTIRIKITYETEDGDSFYVEDRVRVYFAEPDATVKLKFHATVLPLYDQLCRILKNP